MVVISLENKLNKYYIDAYNSHIRNLGTNTNPIYFGVYLGKNEVSNYITTKKLSWKSISEKRIKNSKYDFLTKLPQSNDLNMIISQREDFFNLDFIDLIKIENNNLIGNIYSIRILEGDEENLIEEKNQAIIFKEPKFKVDLVSYIEETFFDDSLKIESFYSFDLIQNKLKKIGFSFLVDEYNQSFSNINLN